MALTAEAEALIARVRAASSLPPLPDRQRIRKDAGVSLRDLGAALGVHFMTVQRWELGTRRPSLDAAIAYADLLNELEAAVNGKAAS